MMHKGRRQKSGSTGTAQEAKTMRGIGRRWTTVLGQGVEIAVETIRTASASSSTDVLNQGISCMSR